MSALKLLGDIQATTMPGPIASGFYSIWESWLSRYNTVVNKVLNFRVQKKKILVCQADPVTWVESVMLSKHR